MIEHIKDILATIFNYIRTEPLNFFFIILYSIIIYIALKSLYSFIILKLIINSI